MTTLPFTFTLKDGRTAVIRELKHSDIEDLMTYANELVGENVKILMNEPQTIESETKFVEDALEKEKANNAVHIVVEVDGKAMGMCHVLRDRQKRSHLGQLGISISKELRGQGLGKKLMETAINLAKEKMNLEMITLTCFASNAPAMKLYDSLGFKKSGHLPKALKHDGEYHDQVEMYKEV